MISRRQFLTALVGSGTVIRSGVSALHRESIDREALVRSHNPVLRQLDSLSPLSLGNGEFAFTADITGLQTLPQLYENAMPLCTMSQWGWLSPECFHRSPDAGRFVRSEGLNTALMAQL